MQSLSVRAFALFPLVAVMACAAPSEQSSAGEGASAGDDRVDVEAVASESKLGSSTSAFSYFAVAKAGRAYRVRRLNGGAMRCAGGYVSDACTVSAIDLSPSLLSNDDAKVVLSEIGSELWAPQLVFLGRVTVDRLRVATFSAYEVWRAPEPRWLLGDVLHVSHATSQALWVNDWSRAKVSGLTFTGAPRLESCKLVDGEYTCAASYDAALAAAKSTAGVLVVGDWWFDGRVRANQYFLKVDVGQQWSEDHFWFCAVGQKACDNGYCESDPILCDVNTGRGRGLIEPIRLNDPFFRSWLLSTAQLTAGDLSR
jgi:hypothetical protein